MWNVVGQPRAVELLRRGLASSRLAHAYLLLGPVSVGKMTLALDLARALNCSGDEVPCGECQPCRRIAEAKHADVSVIELEAGGDEGAESDSSKTRISVEQVKEIQHTASLPPFEGRCRVYILDGVELLSIGAANRLLKTLEEPLDNVVFILLATDESALPATVVSRCQRIELRLLGAGEIESSLIDRWGVPAEKAGLLSRLAGGRLGWAVAAAGDEGVLRQRDEWLDGLLELIGAGNEQRFGYVARMAGGFSRNRRPVQEQLLAWTGWWRDLMLVKLDCAETVTNVDRREGLVEMAGDYGLAEMRAFIESLRLAGERLRLNVNARLALEALMLNIPEKGERLARSV
ncbi:MAG: DNA polymerase III subunit delta' [Dehalococcoidales bacterium]